MSWMVSIFYDVTNGGTNRILHLGLRGIVLHIFLLVYLAYIPGGACILFTWPRLSLWLLLAAHRHSQLKIVIRKMDVIMRRGQSSNLA